LLINQASVVANSRQVTQLGHSQEDGKGLESGIVSQKFIIQTSGNLSGKVDIPPNKSHSFRALVMAGLADGTSRIIHPAESNDWMLATEAFEMFGAVVTPHKDNVWEVQGNGGRLTVPDDIIHCGNSGIFMRFTTAIASLGTGYTVLTGDESLRKIRPVGPIVDGLNQLGATAACTRGGAFAPVMVKGPLKGGRAEIEGRDSQFVSSLLIAASRAEGEAELVVNNPGERPWVDVTLYWLDLMGIKYGNENYCRYRLGGNEKWDGFEYRVPLDWSAALYPVLAALVTEGSEIRISGMNFDDPQGDKEVLDVFRAMGGDARVEDGTVIARSSKLRGIEVDCNNFIDQLPLMAVAGCFAEGETRIVNAGVCREKECDRIAISAEILGGMGADIEQTDDGLVVRNSRLKGIEFDSHNDHRMVMAMSVAAMAAEGSTTIRHCDCVRKTFPRFVEQMAAVGAEIQKKG